MALLAAIILAGCGADEENGTTSKTEKDGGGNGTPSKTKKDGGGNGTPSKTKLITEVCDEAGCTGPTYREANRVFLCRKLEIDTKVLPGPSGETAEQNDGEPDETVPSKTVTTTVRQPQCVGGAIPVEGLHYDELPGVEKSEDGATAWTREPVVIKGKIEDGRLQAAE